MGIKQPFFTAKHPELQDPPGIEDFVASASSIPGVSMLKDIESVLSGSAPAVSLGLTR